MMVTNILLTFLIFLILSIIGFGVYIWFKYVKKFLNDADKLKTKGKDTILKEFDEITKIFDKMF
jgi:uncharacterized protein YneF (UPF0154 family)